MEESCIAVEDVRESIMGGGVIPVAVDENGELLVLLGKERYINHWRGSLKWSGFEGGRKFNESIEETAAREFTEESMGVVSVDENKEFSTIEKALEKIRSEDYFTRVLLCINHNDHGVEEKRFHVTYVIEVPYQPECCDKFLDLRKQFLDFQAKLLQYKKILDQLSFEYPFIREDDIIKGKKVKAISDVRVIDKELVVTYVAEDGVNNMRKEVQRNDMLSLYLRWYSSRIQMDAEIKTLCHLGRSLLVERNCIGFFVNAKLNEEYIEKQEIQWWKLSELDDVIENGGFRQSEFFRAYFLPVLQRSIEELKKHVQRK